VFGMALLFVGTPSYAHDWSDAQVGVWNDVEKYWELSANEDLEGFMSYFHDDFLGWAQGQWFPTNKADRRADIERSFETSESVFYALKPAGIKIHGDVAIVHYYFTDTSKDAKGEEETVSGHWTDILMKQGDKWVMIGDAGGVVPEDD
jgi:ketosteroid isomerase-like protein